jgi:dimethylsulfone monooxygenase
MRFGIWTPLPHTIRPEPRMERAIEALKGQRSDPGPDAAFQFAVDVLQRGERHGFDVTLIATRELGPDPEAWTTAAALAGHTKTMELMVAVHPGIITPAMVAKMGASLDRISGGRLERRRVQPVRQRLPGSPSRTTATSGWTNTSKSSSGCGPRRC